MKKNKHKYLAFDIETAKVMPEHEPNWKSCRPLGISCAATLLTDTDEVHLWRGQGDRMSREDAGELVEYLSSKAAKGYTILTWNGLGFDFDILAEESGRLDECRELARGHLDMMFHILCRLGYGVSLQAAANGMGLPGKPEGMNGALAPVLWAEGKQQTVLDYVSQDVRTTAELAMACESCGSFHWISKSGNRRTMRLPRGWLTVEQAEKMPVPNTLWMRDPWRREEFTGWLR